MKNIQADTAMREAISATGAPARSVREDA